MGDSFLAWIIFQVSISIHYNLIRTFCELNQLFKEDNYDELKVL